MEVLYHGLVFAVGVTLLVLLASFVAATALRTLLLDVAWYSEATQSLLENVRVVGVYDGSTVYYAVANAGTRQVTLSAIAVVQHGGAVTVASSVTLQPGEVYQGSWNTTVQPVAVLATTSRGSAFAGKVYPVVAGHGVISIRSPLPALHVLASPISHVPQLHQVTNASATTVLTVATRGYVFGFFYVRELENATSVVHTFGPYFVDELFAMCTNCTTLLNVTHSVQRSTGGGTLYVTARLVLRLNTTSAGNVSFVLSLPVNATVVAPKIAGVYIRGCVGFGWKISSATVFSFTENATLPATHKSTGVHFYADDLIILYIPAHQSASLPSLATTMLPLLTAGEATVATTPPIAGYGDVVFARCFAAGDKTVNSIAFAPSDTPSVTHGGTTYYSYLVFPGANPHASSTVAVNSIDLMVAVRSDVLVRYLLSLP